VAVAVAVAVVAQAAEAALEVILEVVGVGAALVRSAIQPLVFLELVVEFVLSGVLAAFVEPHHSHQPT
jgi:hypothetical protein